MKSKNREDQVGGYLWEGTAQSLPRGAESVLYLDLGSGYTDVYTCTKTHQALSLRFLCFMSCKLYLKRKKEKIGIPVAEVNKRVLKIHLLSLHPTISIHPPLGGL